MLTQSGKHKYKVIWKESCLVGYWLISTAKLEVLVGMLYHFSVVYITCLSFNFLQHFKSTLFLSDVGQSVHAAADLS